MKVLPYYFHMQWMLSSSAGQTKRWDVDNSMIFIGLPCYLLSYLATHHLCRERLDCQCCVCKPYRQLVWSVLLKKGHVVGFFDGFILDMLTWINARAIAQNRLFSTQHHSIRCMHVKRVRLACYHSQNLHIQKTNKNRYRCLFTWLCTINTILIISIKHINKIWTQFDKNISAELWVGKSSIVTNWYLLKSWRKSCHYTWQWIFWT